MRQRQKEAPTVGLEPTTTWLRAKRSTDWARRALLINVSPVPQFQGYVFRLPIYSWYANPLFCPTVKLLITKCILFTLPDYKIDYIAASKHIRLFWLSCYYGLDKNYI